MPSKSAKKSKKRIKPSFVEKSTITINNNVSKGSSGKKAKKQQDGISAFYNEQLFLNPENYIDKIGQSEEQIEEFANKIEHIGYLLKEKKDQIFYDNLESDLKTMNTDQYLNLFEDNMIIESEEKSIENDENNQESHILKQVVYRNRLFNKDIYILLETSTIIRNQQEQDDGEEDCDDDEEDMNVQGSIKLTLYDGQDKENILCLIEEQAGEEVQEDQIKDQQLKELIKKDLRINVGKSKNIKIQDLVQGLREYFVDRISENFPMDE